MPSLFFILISVFLAPFAAAGLPCGTRWLEAHRSEMPLPTAAKLAVPQQQEIKVGTPLGVPVSGDVFLRPSTCRYVGENAYIFVEDSLWDVLVVQPDVDKLGALFDVATPADSTRGIYEMATETFGAVPDVDGDPHVFIFIIDMPNDNVVGYFDPRISTHVDESQRRDAVYLDAFRLNSDPFLTRGTLAHEFQHLIHWGHDEDEEDWIEEGLSGYAEELTGFAETDPRMVPGFLENPSLNLTAWPFLSSEATPHYGATYLFASFLHERYGPEMIRTLVAERRNGIFGVDEAFKEMGLVQNYAGAWGLWVAGNYAADDSFYGYRALRGRRVQSFPITDLPLEPTEGQVSQQWGTTNLVLSASGNIQVEFAGVADGRYIVWGYAMRGATGEMVAMELDEFNAGSLQMADVDSAALVVGRTSLAGGKFTLAAQHYIPTDVPTAVTAASTKGEGFALGGAYPNPFNGGVQLPFSLGLSGETELVIFNSLGQRVQLLYSGYMGAGVHQLHWDGRDERGVEVASGLYQAVLRAQGQVSVRGLTLIK
ncbi:MAG: FlgD immunoglobulin-like domain containing protein [Candidatus Latescibacterota bacterium]|jgi:hypothetical protein